MLRLSDSEANDIDTTCMGYKIYENLPVGAKVKTIKKKKYQNIFGMWIMYALGCWIRFYFSFPLNHNI